MDQEVCATGGVFEGDTLGRRERGAQLEELLCDILVFSSKLVGDADWNGVEFLYFEGSRLDQRVQHGRLEGAASCYAVLGVEGTRQFFFTKYRLDGLLHDWDSRGFAHKFHRVYPIARNARSAQRRLQSHVEIAHEGVHQSFEISTLKMLVEILVLHQRLAVNFCLLISC